MDILGQLSGGLSREQVIFERIEKILSKNQGMEEEMKSDEYTVSKEDAKFIQLHVKNKCPKYSMYFGDYNNDMFHKLWSNMWYKTFEKGDVIFDKESKADWFYYILKGSVHLYGIDSQGNQKIDNLYHENQVFGLVKTEKKEEIPKRNKQAVAENPTAVLIFDSGEYEGIRKQRVLSAAETKIEFLTQYIPGFRSVSEKVVHELETIFQKEKVTKGYRLLEQGKINDFLYFILSGECRIIYNYNANKLLKRKFDSIEASTPSYMLIGKLNTGDCFGQASACEKQPCKYSIQALSEEVELYKISWNSFYQNFGKDNGKPVKELRAKAVMDKNWIGMILKRLAHKSIERIMSECEFVDKAHDNHAIRSIVNESPYLK